MFDPLTHHILYVNSCLLRRTLHEQFKLKKNKPSPAYGLQSKSLLQIH